MGNRFSRNGCEQRVLHKMGRSERMSAATAMEARCRSEPISRKLLISWWFNRPPLWKIVKMGSSSPISVSCHHRVVYQYVSVVSFKSTVPVTRPALYLKKLPKVGDFDLFSALNDSLDFQAFWAPNFQLFQDVFSACLNLTVFPTRLPWTVDHPRVPEGTKAWCRRQDSNGAHHQRHRRKEGCDPPQRP